MTTGNHLEDNLDKELEEHYREETMYQYDIKENGHVVGSARGQSNAFKFIQKEIDRCGLLGYWQGLSYIVEGKPLFTIERTIE